MIDASARATHIITQSSDFDSLDYVAFQTRYTSRITQAMRDIFQEEISGSSSSFVLAVSDANNYSVFDTGPLIDIELQLVRDLAATRGMVGYSLIRLDKTNGNGASALRALRAYDRVFSSGRGYSPHCDCFDGIPEQCYTLTAQDTQDSVDSETRILVMVFDCESG
jgi:hypothetical protein